MGPRSLVCRGAPRVKPSAGGGRRGSLGGPSGGASAADCLLACITGDAVRRRLVERSGKNPPRNPDMRSPMKLLPGCLALLILPAIWFASQRPSTGQQPGTEARSTFMRMKLEPVKKILESIATEDYE